MLAAIRATRRRRPISRSIKLGLCFMVPLNKAKRGLSGPATGLRNEEWYLSVHGSLDRKEDAQSNLNGVDMYAIGAEADRPNGGAGIIGERDRPFRELVVAIEHAEDHILGHLPVKAYARHPAQPCVAGCGGEGVGPAAIVRHADRLRQGQRPFDVTNRGAAGEV